MKPKKTKQLIPELAKKLQLSEKEIESVINVYWDNIRKTLSSLDYTHVNLKGLGTFYMKPWMVDKRLRINGHVINKYIENPTAGGLTILNKLSQDNLKLNLVKEELEKQSLKKKSIKDERRNQSLEGKEQDS